MLNSVLMKIDKDRLRTLRQWIFFTGPVIACVVSFLFVYQVLLFIVLSSITVAEKDKHLFIKTTSKPRIFST